VRQARGSPLADVLAMGLALMNLATHATLGSLERTDRVFAFVVDALNKRGLTKCAPAPFFCLCHRVYSANRFGYARRRISGRHDLDLFVQLLTRPLDVHTPVTLLALEHYRALMPFLDRAYRVRVAKTVAGAVSRRGKPLASPEKAARLFEFLAPLVTDDAEGGAQDADEEDFAEEQGVVARIVHLVDNKDTDIAFQARRLFFAFFFHFLT
jgi:hypothetical protein